MRHPALCLTLLLAAAQGSCLGEPTPEVRRRPVIDGAESPEDLGVEISSYEQQAVVGQVATVGGSRYQGCSGTVVGDRVVAVAGHCVVMNQEEWIGGGEPEVIDPSELSYVVGSDVDHPLCELEAEEVRLHPEIAMGMMAIVHDVALVVLADRLSVLGLTCRPK